jgi:hypothetical protein
MASVDSIRFLWSSKHGFAAMDRIEGILARWEKTVPVDRAGHWSAGLDLHAGS